MTTLVLLIVALAVLIVAECWVIYYLHKKIGIYKEQQRKWAKEPCLDSLEFALRMVRKYSDKYHPEGEPQLNLATYKISQYCKQLRWRIERGLNPQEYGQDKTGD